MHITRLFLRKIDETFEAQFEKNNLCLNQKVFLKLKKVYKQKTFFEDYKVVYAWCKGYSSDVIDFLKV